MPIPNTNFHPPFNITRASHLVFTVRDLAKSREFYTEVMGLIVSDENADTLWLRGTVSIRAWLLGRGAVCRGSRLVPTAACGAPAFGQYKPGAQGTFTPWSLIVLELAGDRIANITHFLDTQTLFPRFGLPQSLPA